MSTRLCIRVCARARASQGRLCLLEALFRLFQDAGRDFVLGEERPEAGARDGADAAAFEFDGVGAVGEAAEHARAYRQ